MPTNYFVPDGRDFENYFEPDPDGPVVEGFFAADGNYLRYAALSRGSKAGDVAHYRSDGLDVSNIWAGIGTVAYTVPVGDVGNYNGPFGQTCPITWDNGNHLRTYTQFTMRNNGTWDLMGYSTNFVDDRRANQNGGILQNDTNGRVLASGNWLARTGPGAGNGYTVEFVQEAFEWGRVDYPDYAGTANYQVNNARGAFNDQTGQLQNLGNFGLESDRAVLAMLDQIPTANNYSLRDRNAGLSRYNRGWIRVYVRRNGQTLLSFRVAWNNQNRWIKSNDA